MAQHPNSRRAFRHNQLRGNVAMAKSLIANVVLSSTVTTETSQLAHSIALSLAKLEEMVKIRVDPPKED